VRHSEATCDIVAEIARLEAELADLRIADRASEILAQRDPAQETVKAVHRHIERVLEGTDSASTLKQQLETLRSQVQDRRLVNRAKAFLQKTRRMSEEEAYLHLRNASRRERRPLREIANEVLC
jgi:AmiR/NasT family two-component response regulator